METAHDRLKLAGIGVDIADGENAGPVGSNADVSIATRLFSTAMPQLATGPSFMVRPKNGSIVSHEIFVIALSLS
jgi:hypothetical protein